MNYKMGPLRLEDEPIDWLSLQAAVDVFDWEHGNVPRENLLQILFRQKEREPWVHDELVSACLHKHSGDPAISHFMQSAEWSEVEPWMRNMTALFFCGVLPISLFSALPTGFRLNYIYMAPGRSFLNMSLYQHRLGHLTEEDQMQLRGFGCGVSIYEHAFHIFNSICSRIDLAYPQKMNLRAIVRFVLQNKYSDSMAIEFDAAFDPSSDVAYERDTNLYPSIATGEKDPVFFFWKTMLEW